DAGLDYIPSNDFSLYDQVLDAAVAYGAIPARYKSLEGLTQYFAMARGIQQKDVPVSLHPETTTFELAPADRLKPLQHFLEAKNELGIVTRPVLLGPVTFLELSRASRDAPVDFNKWATFLNAAVGVFADLLATLGEAGAETVQVDEPCLVLDVSGPLKTAYTDAYTLLGSILANKRASGATIPKLVVTTYFEALRENLTDVFAPAILPVVDGIHVDLIRTLESLDPVAYAKDVVAAVAAAGRQGFSISLGVVDGRNVWKTDLARAIGWLDAVRALDLTAAGVAELVVASSCSLLHSPHSTEAEKNNKDKELVSWLAFAVQKVHEIVTITTALRDGPTAVAAALADNAASIESRKTSKRIHNATVAARVAAVTRDMYARKSPYPTRQQVQAAALGLPAFPTTTIGSFPQTASLRKIRAQNRAGSLATEEYERLLREEIQLVVGEQEALGLDVLVHGEPERNDMVEYFGELLDGYGFTANGWVQSYGSRGVKPPIIYGDVSRPEPMTVRWSTYAQTLSTKPVKGMLTGPITMLCWSFVRDDQPRSATAQQLALAIRDEVVDLAEAVVPPELGVPGHPTRIRAIQIDEPALREGLPLRRRLWQIYLDWAVDAFRLASSGVADDVQIHSHMCYAEFQDIRDAIVALDCDVLSIENAKNDMQTVLADGTAGGDSVLAGYPNEVGPGLFDIHTSRVPPQTEMAARLAAVAAAVGDPRRVWVNPDCGLKTRQWKETREALSTMVAVAVAARS
ncbi:methionine-synthesizing 5- methyltetrahydropteroyltriglutamate--homocysteine methyltransferase, partial [Cladochytrium tenue]